MVKKIGNVEIKMTADKNRPRLYFSERGKTGACWDVNKQEWIKVHCEFGPVFKDAIKKAFGL